MGLAVLDNRVIVSMAPNIILYTDVNRDRRFDPAVDKGDHPDGFNGRKHDHTVHSVNYRSRRTVVLERRQLRRHVYRQVRKNVPDRQRLTIPPMAGARSDLGWEPTKIAGSQSDDGHVWIGGFAARMNPDGSGVHIIGHNFRNSYEQTVTSFGDVFQNDNDDPRPVALRSCWSPAMPDSAPSTASAPGARTGAQARACPWPSGGRRIREPCPRGRLWGSSPPGLPLSRIVPWAPNIAVCC